MPNKHYLFGTAIFAVLITAALGLAYVTWQDYTTNQAERQKVAALAREFQGERQQAAGDAQNRISVYSQPSGATVMIDGDSVGTTPMQDVPVSEAAFLLSLDKARYTSLDTVLVPGPNSRASYSFFLEPAASGQSPGEQEYSGTEDLLGAGDSVGDDQFPDISGNSDTEAPAADTSLLAEDSEASGGRAEEDTRAQIPPRPSGSSGSDAPTSSPAPESALGTLSILVEPWGTIYIDDRLHKMDTDVTYTVRLPRGVHRLRVEHPALGTLNRPVEVTGDTVRVVMNFNQAAEVVVNSTPASGEIFVNGRPTGFRTPTRLAMPVGRHTIGVSRDDQQGAELTQEILLEEGQIDTLSFSTDVGGSTSDLP